jgi:aspartate dehydrogenase
MSGVEARPSVLLIGWGAIGRLVIERLGDQADITVLARPGRSVTARQTLPANTRIVERLEDVEPLTLAVECGGHGAIAEHGTAVLSRGAELVVVSTGALADAVLFERLRSAAERGRGRLSLVAGAVGGIDALSAAREGGLSKVVYIGRKPPAGWRDTAAEKVVDLDRLTGAAEVYRGSAGEAARRFPQNANVAATIALAGLGLDATAATLIADPAAPGNVHRIEAEGAFGRFVLEFIGRTLPGNPKTSMMAALSVVRAIRNRVGRISIWTCCDWKPGPSPSILRRKRAARSRVSRSRRRAAPSTSCARPSRSRSPPAAAPARRPIRWCRIRAASRKGASRSAAAPSCWRRTGPGSAIRCMATAGRIPGSSTAAPRPPPISSMPMTGAPAGRSAMSPASPSA